MEEPSESTVEARGQDFIAVTMLGPAEAVLFGTEETIESLARSSDPIPENLVAGARHLAAAAPELAGLGERMSGRWVKLTRESAQALAKQGPTTSPAGAIYGVVRSADGSIARHLTFVNPGRLSQVASTLPSLGFAAAMQIQQASIEKKLDDIKKGLDSVIKHLGDETLAELGSSLQVLDDTYHSVERNGRLDDDHWQMVANLAQEVRRLHELTSRKLASLKSALSESDMNVGRRVTALNRALRQDDTLHWLEAHVHAELAMLRWQSLYLLRQAEQHPETIEELVTKLEAERRNRHQVLQDLAGDIAMYLTDGSRTRTVLERVRIISRTRLDRLLKELERVLAVYRQELGTIGIGPGAGQLALPPGQQPSSLVSGEVNEDERRWLDLIRHLGKVPGWAGEARQRAAVFPEKLRSRRTGQHKAPDGT